ncbi:MAG TPA: hypothetical protein VM899_03980 [Rubellimicrobium sp.]|nr:hypothetical protein [Rubellimicrobium sp.]
MLAPQEIAFYATPALKERLGVERSTRRLGALLQQSHSLLNRTIAQAHRDSVVEDLPIELDVAHMHNLSPEAVASEMLEMGSRGEALAVVSAEHPLIPRTAALSLISPAPAIRSS